MEVITRSGVFAALICLGVLFGAVIVCAAGQSQVIKWQRDLSSAKAVAKKTGKPIMMDFCAEWCQPCKKMDEEAFRDSRVVHLSEKFVCVRIDVDKHADIAEHYKIEGLPTLIFLDSRARYISRTTGYRAPDDFLKVLGDVLKKIEHPKEEGLSNATRAPGK